MLAHWQEYNRLSQAGESEESIFASLRDLIALELEKPTGRENLSTRHVRSVGSIDTLPSTLAMYLSLSLLEARLKRVPCLACVADRTPA